MVSETLELVIRTSGASAAGSQLGSIGAQARAATASVNEMAAAFRLMRNTLVAFSFLRTFEGVAQAVNSFQSMNNQLRIVTTSLAKANELQIALAGTAIRTRSAYAETVGLFSAIARATTTMGLDFNQINDITEKINMSLIESGANSNQAKNSVRDLIELLNQGVVQGRIFRSLLMQDPVLLNAVAQTIVATGKNAAAVNKQLETIRNGGKNVSGGGLRELTLKNLGAFSSDGFVRAIQTSTLMGDNWTKTAVTMGQAFENLKTQAMLFFASTALGVTNMTSLSSAIEYVGNNLKGLSVIIGVLVVSALLPFAGGIAIALAAMAPFIAIAAGVIAAVTGLVEHFTGLKVGMADIPAAFATVYDILTKDWSLVTEVMGDVFKNMLNGLLNGLGNFGNEVLHLFTQIKTVANDIAHGNAQNIVSDLSKLPATSFFNTGRSTNNLPAGWLAGGLSPMDLLKQQSRQAFLKEQLSSELGGAAPFNVQGKPAGSGQTVNVDQASVVKDLAAKHATALQDLEGELSKFAGPAAKYQDDIDKLTKNIKGWTSATKDAKGNTIAPLLKESAVAAVFAAVGFDDYNEKTRQSVEFNKAAAREVLGLKNGDLELSNTLKMVNEAWTMQAITLPEYTKAVEDATKKHDELALSMQNTVAAGIKLAQLGLDKAHDTQDVAKSTASKALGMNKSGSVENLNTQIATLNQMMAAGSITGQTYHAMLIDVQDEFLKGKTDALSGFNQGLLDIQKTMGNTAGDITKTMTSAFDTLEKTLTNFADTGKFTIKDMMNSIRHDLDSLIVKQGIMKPLMDMLGGDSSTGGVGGSIGGDLRGLLSKALGGGSGGSGGGSPFGGILSLFGMGGRGGNQVQSTGSLLPSPLSANDLLLNDLPHFANGGSFSVGGSGAVDSQLVAFKATPGENVSVGGGGTHVVINDNRTSQSAAPVSTRSSVGQDGRTQLEVTIGDIVDKNLAAGKHDTTMSTSFGINRSGAYGAFNPASSPGSL